VRSDEQIDRVLKQATPGRMFRRRWGAGRACYGVLVQVDVQLGVDSSLRGKLVTLADLNDTSRRRQRIDVDLLNLPESNWAPLFVSKIRARARRA